MIAHNKGNNFLRLAGTMLENPVALFFNKRNELSDLAGRGWRGGREKKREKAPFSEVGTINGAVSPLLSFINFQNCFAYLGSNCAWKSRMNANPCYSRVREFKYFIVIASEKHDRLLKPNYSDRLIWTFLHVCSSCF